jgi:bifunctional non-homologous end joining protein LigD
VTLSFPLSPMKATMGTLPATDDGWAYEVKWDGYRTVVFIDAGTVRLQSTSGKDVTDRWPEFAGLAASVNATSAVLDAELVVFDDDGRPSFELVQQSGVGTDREAVLHLFDVLSVDGTDTIDLPYLDRRRLLDAVVESGRNWLVPAHRIGDGAALVAATAAQRLEGVIAKRIDSVYRPGTRSKQWVKIKNRTVVELPIGGYTEGAGNRAGTFGSLLLGRPVGPDLAFAGGVGTGFTHDVLESIAKRLRSIEVATCPFVTTPSAKHLRDAHWVEPLLVAIVEIAEFTNEGLVRHASFIGLRADGQSVPDAD